MRKHLALAALVAVAALSGCGASEETGACEFNGRDAYPLENIGTGEGSTIANLTFENSDGSTFSLGDIFADESKRVLVLTTTAGWCTACIEEQPKLAALHKELAGDGLEVVAALFEDAQFAPATLDQAKQWKEEYKLPFPVVLDDEFQFGAYYDPAQTPLNMVVDVDCMQIVYKSTGFDEQVIRAVVEANL